MLKKGTFPSLVIADWHITDVHIATSPWEYHDLKISLSTRTSKITTKEANFPKILRNTSTKRLTSILSTEPFSKVLWPQVSNSCSIHSATQPSSEALSCYNHRLNSGKGGIKSSLLRTEADSGTHISKNNFLKNSNFITGPSHRWSETQHS